MAGPSRSVVREEEPNCIAVGCVHTLRQTLAVKVSLLNWMAHLVTATLMMLAS